MDIETIDSILSRTSEMKKNPSNYSRLLDGKVIGTCFFEPSTRTYESFKTAIAKLGAKQTGFSDPSGTSLKKGETFYDTLTTIGNYADALIIRSPYEGTAQLAADILDKPIINAGDGANQHPTQTLLDLFTIEEQGGLNGEKISIMGGIKKSRTVNSLAYGVAKKYPDAEIWFVAPKSMMVDQRLIDEIEEMGSDIVISHSPEDTLDSKILYTCRIQEERFTAQQLRNIDISEYIIDKKFIQKIQNPNLRIMHPMPRKGELHPSVDKTQHALYWQQSKNGVWTRMGILGGYIFD